MANPSRTGVWEGAWAQKAGAPFQAGPGLIGRTAHELLVGTGCAGRVLAVVSGAVYLRTDRDEILWLTPIRQGTTEGTCHARGVACGYDETAVRAGMAFDSRQGLLQIGHRPALDLRDRTLWSPRLVSTENVASRQAAMERLARLIESLPPLDGGDPRPAGFDELARQVAQACLGHDTDRALLQCQRLVGLGPGLTPAGDDFVGGLLFAAWHLQRAYPGRVPWDEPAVRGLLRSAWTGTNLISRCILSDLAGGDGPAALHELVFALVAADGDGGAMEHASRMRQLGSSTGREMLAGALTGMLLLSDPMI